MPALLAAANYEQTDPAVILVAYWTVTFLIPLGVAVAFTWMMCYQRLYSKSMGTMIAAWWAACAVAWAMSVSMLIYGLLDTSHGLEAGLVLLLGPLYAGGCWLGAFSLTWPFAYGAKRLWDYLADVRTSQHRRNASEYPAIHAQSSPERTA